jgi:hypothetical protein
VFVSVVLAIFGILVAIAIVLVLVLGISSIITGRREATRIASQRLTDARNDAA